MSASILTTTSGAVSFPAAAALKVWDFEANEVVNTQDHNALESQSEQSFQGAVQYNGSCNCSLYPGSALAMGPFKELFDLAAATDDAASDPPTIFPASYELGLTQGIRPYVIAPAGSGPAFVAAVGTKIASTFRLIGFADPAGAPTTIEKWNNQRFNLKAYLTDATYLVYNAIIQGINSKLQDGIVDVTISGRNSGNITADASPILNPASLGGAATFTFATGKTVSGDILFTEISIVRDAGKCEISAKWVNKGAMTWAWGS
jgi:hypothetical protein